VTKDLNLIGGLLTSWHMAILSMEDKFRVGCGWMRCRGRGSIQLKVHYNSFPGNCYFLLNHSQSSTKKFPDENKMPEID